MGGVLDIQAADLSAFFVDIVEVAIILLSLYCLAKYVFLERIASGRKSIVIYGSLYVLYVIISAIMTFCVAGDSTEGVNSDFDGLLQLLYLIGFLIVLAISRKEKKWFALFEIIPLVGLCNGLMLPFARLPEKFMEGQTEKILIYKSILYVAILLGFLLFWHFGSGWRKKFDEEVEHRHLSNWEYALLFIIGTLLLVFSLVITIPVNEIREIIPEEILNETLVIIGAIGVWASVIAFVMAMTIIIAIMVGNKQAFYHKKVADMQLNIIIMMAEIVENRDENTGGHIQRTAKYVDIIANQLYKEEKYKDILNEEYINDMKIAAPLHDIGKIHVSDLILNKAGRLTEEEFEIMKTHAAEGRKLLSHAKEHLGDFNYLDIAVQMAGYHHEWWNGSEKGYPDRISGESIPLCARIMAVADVFDALTSKRCYKEPMPVEKAYQIIREESGTHFDSAVVDAFFSASDQIEKALDTFLTDGQYHCHA